MKQYDAQEYKEGDAVQTRGGKAVRILCTDAGGSHPVVGLVEGYVRPYTWTAGGEIRRSSTTPHLLDLFFAPKVTKLWVNVYRGIAESHTLSGGKMYPTKEQAEEGVSMSDRYVGAFEITIEE